MHSPDVERQARAIAARLVPCLEESLVTSGTDRAIAKKRAPALALAEGRRRAAAQNGLPAPKRPAAKTRPKAKARRRPRRAA